MPYDENDFPFQLRACRENEDIKLLTTNDTLTILQLIKVFEIEDEISRDLRRLLDAAPDKRNSVIALHNYPKKGQNYAYTAILDCDLCGVRTGFFALFKSRSGDVATLTRECKLMYEFINGELQKSQDLQELNSHLSTDHYSTN
jgi:hypothetical protein